MSNHTIIKRPVVLTVLLILAIAAATLGASAASTTKALSTNFTLVNLANGSNTVNIQYIKPDGTPWRPSEQETMAAQGDQVIRAQYLDPQLTSGSGSVVVGGTGPMGAVVQIQARSPQIPTRGAYSGATGGAPQVNAPYVAKKLVSASGIVNAQIIIQNTGTADTTVDVELVSSADGQVKHTKQDVPIKQGASYTYDLADESNLSDGFFGSAVVKAATGGQVAVVVNVFNGSHTVQTYNAFANTAQVWLVPLFTSRLDNTLSTPIAVQNLSGGPIPVDGINVSCVKDPSSPGNNFTMKNSAAVNNNATYFFNPVTNTDIPGRWYGSCRVVTTGFNTVAFVQMRVVSGDQAGAYEAIPANGTKKKVVIPLYAKQLTNGFASVVTIQNLNSGAAANVTVQYKGASGLPANCSGSLPLTIAAGGSALQNHRISSGANSVPSIGANCYGTMVITSADQPIDAFVQLTDISGLPGDTFQAHNAFTTD